MSVIVTEKAISKLSGAIANASSSSEEIKRTQATEIVAQAFGHRNGHELRNAVSNTKDEKAHTQEGPFKKPITLICELYLLDGVEMDSKVDYLYTTFTPEKLNYLWSLSDILGNISFENSGGYLTQRWDMGGIQRDWDSDAIQEQFTKLETGSDLNLKETLDVLYPCVVGTEMTQLEMMPHKDFCLTLEKRHSGQEFTHYSPNLSLRMLKEAIEAGSDYVFVGYNYARPTTYSYKGKPETEIPFYPNN